MRKKLIAVFIVFAIALLHVSAYEFIMTPWQGGFGLNMASPKYDFPSGTSAITYEVTDTTGSAGERTRYTDAEIIGIVGVHDIDTEIPGDHWWSPTTSEYDPDGMTITARCDGGFYFTSRSNPDAKRPFEIKLVLKRSNYEDGWIWDRNNTNHSSAYDTLGTESDNNTASTSYPERGASWDIFWGIGDYRYRTIWCDLVIILPFDSITSTGVLTANGRTYNLVEADDYSAIVTIEIEFNDETRSITIPLSGYYSRNPSAAGIQTASLSVNALPRAMNLNIGGTRRMERVADIDFMANQTEFDITSGSLKTDQIEEELPKFHLFLSASNDSTHSEDRGFELVHSSVNYSEPHTPYNSIGYTARLINDDTGEYMDFDGTDAFTGGNDIPGLIAAQIHEVNQGHNIFYSEFHGGVEVLIDEISATGNQEGINKMLSGQYTSTIYIHVVGE